MQIFYINLKRRTDRNEEFLRRNSCAAECHRVDAPEGASLCTQDFIAAALIAEPLEAYSSPVLANALSHKELWERAVASSGPMTIAEDDAVLNLRFAEKAAKTVARLPADWDLILWGWNFDSILDCEVIPGLKQGVIHCDPAPLRHGRDFFQAIDADPMPLRMFNAFGILCYSLSPKGADLLLRRCFPLKNEMIYIPGLKRRVRNFSIDAAMNKYYRIMKAFVSFPPLAWSENDKADSSLFPSQDEQR